MGQQVIVDNKPGGNTLVATQELVRSKPDGYTLLMQTNNLAANPTLYKGKIPFDTTKDLVPVALVAGNPHVLVVNPSVPVNNLAEYIALAKAAGYDLFATRAAAPSTTLLASFSRCRPASTSCNSLQRQRIGDARPARWSGRFARTDAHRHGFIKERSCARSQLPRRSDSADCPIPTIAESGYPLRLQLVVRHSCRHVRRSRSSIASMPKS
jgi:hypothetical protein